LTAEQIKVALQSKQFGEIPQAVPKQTVGQPVGLAAGKMNEKQKAVLLSLLKGYSGRWPAEIAAAELKAIDAAGFDNVYFAYARDDNRPGRPYTYRVHGPTFLIEFLNVQEDGANNPGNHIHSAWRFTKGDFGLTQ